MPTWSREPVHATRPMLRSAAFGWAGVLVSLAGHVVAGGRAPDAAGLLIALTMVICAYRLLLARRERSWAVLLVALGLVQVVLHEVFMAWASVDPTSGIGPHGMRPMAGPGMSTGVEPMSGMAGPSLVPTAVMLLAHLLASVLLAAVLRAGEAASWAAARRGAVRLWRPVGRMLLAVLATLTAGVSTARVCDRAAVPAADLPRRRPLWATAGRRRRGPPWAARPAC